MTNLLQALTIWTPLVMHPMKDAATHDLLRGVLAEPDPVVRERALEALALAKSPADVVLVRKLREAAFEATRQQAARTAVALGEPLGAREAATTAATRRMVPVAGGPTLAVAVRSGDALGIAGALRRLEATEIGGGAAAVLALLDHAEIVVQEEAVRAVQRGLLVQAGPKLLQKLADPDEALRRASAEALGAMATKLAGAETIAAVVKRMEFEESSLVRQAAGNVLVARHDEASLAALRKLLSHARGVTRQAAVQAWGAWGDAELAREIEPLLGDSADLVARTAAESLGQLKHPASKAPLIAALPGRSPFVQEKIAWALGELRAAEAIGALTKLLGTTQETLKVEVIQALGKTGDKAALPPLRQVLASISVMHLMPRTRVAALEALLEAKDKLSLPRASALVTDLVVPPPPGGGPSHDDNSVRVAALRFLAALGDKNTGVALQAAFKYMAPRDIRPAVAETYTRLLGRTYVPLPDEDSRGYFVESLRIRDRVDLPLPGVKVQP